MFDISRQNGYEYITDQCALLKLHLAYVLRWNRGKNIYFFSHI